MHERPLAGFAGLVFSSGPDGLVGAGLVDGDGGVAPLALVLTQHLQLALQVPQHRRRVVGLSGVEITALFALQPAGLPLLLS